MATVLNFSSGAEEYIINGVCVRINWSDQNLYTRLFGLKDAVSDLEKEYSEKINALESIDPKTFPKTEGGEVDVRALSDEQCNTVSSRTKTLMSIMTEIDSKVKDELRSAFGGDADIDGMFMGVNCMAVDAEGNRILYNFMNAIEPLLKEAAKRLAKSNEEEVNGLVGNREQRRARNRRVQSGGTGD